MLLEFSSRFPFSSRGYQTNGRKHLPLRVEEQTNISGNQQATMSHYRKSSTDLLPPPSLTYVLLCSGYGSDPNHFRPNRDDSQWWGRRDALVRCTCAALYTYLGCRSDCNKNGVKGRISNHNSSSSNSDIELVLLFDEDHARLRMRRCASVSSKASSSKHDKMWCPCEKNIISLWKRAACNPNRQIIMNGLSCICEVDGNTNTNRACNRKVQNMNTKSLSKKQLLHLIREATRDDEMDDAMKANTITFLRKWNLNSSDDAVLRKVNRSKLEEAWNDYMSPKMALNKIDSSCGNLSITKSARMKDSFRAILSTYSFERTETKEYENRNTMISSSPSASNAAKRRKVEGYDTNDTLKSKVVLYLHETCELELPCFGINPCQKKLFTFDNIFIFLGAVRDMSNDEYLALAQVCDDSMIPMCGCNLGRTAEFTSKVVTAISCHHINEKLFSAVEILFTRAKTMGLLGVRNITSGKSQGIYNSIIEKNKSSEVLLHFIFLLPFSKEEVVSDISERNIWMWTLVRITVCALWRSRLASGVEEGNTNKLTLILSDGVFITFSQLELVQFLASKHQAAPSEHQILRAISEKLQEIGKRNGDDWETILCDIGKVSSPEAITMFHFRKLTKRKKSVHSLFENIYRRNCICSCEEEIGAKGNEYIFVMDHLVQEHFERQQQNSKRDITDQMPKSLKRFAKKRGLKLHRYEVLVDKDDGDDFYDSPATLVTMLQHFSYHGILCI